MGLSVPDHRQQAGAAAVAAKRAIDVAIAAVAALVFLPVIALLAGIGLLAQGSPVFFRQTRVGRGGELFTLVKFRTMSNERDASGRLLPDEERVTAIGNFLRRFRLDELPSFLTILAGKMSLVGPRPLPPEVLATIPGSMERHRVRPGFTGLAQVSGNTLLTNQEKVALDLYYIRNWSLREDAAILLRTVGTIVSGERRDEALIARALADRHKPLAIGESVPPREAEQP